MIYAAVTNRRVRQSTKKYSQRRLLLMMRVDVFPQERQLGLSLYMAAAGPDRIDPL
jgi:hypothetical protein